MAEGVFGRAAVRSPRGCELVLVLGTYRPAVTVVRALARAGRRAVVGREPDHRHKAESAGAEFSRHTTAVWDHPLIKDDPSAFLDALVGELARRTEPVHVLPLDETTLVLLARERSRLPANTSLAAPATETILTCVDKERCLDAARTAGLSVPPWEVVHGYEELLAAAGRAAAPVVVKPLWPHSRLLHDRKAILCRDSSDLARQIPAWPTGHDRLLVQRMAEGLRHNLSFAARDGELLDVVEALIVRTNRRDGTGLAVEGRTRPVSVGLREQLRALVAHLRYTGVGCGQFLVQPGAQDGAFLELNPRLDANHVFADYAGLDLANLAVDLAADVPVEPRVPVPTGCGGHTFAWTFGDLAGLWCAIGQGEITRAGALAELGRIARTAVLADMHITWSWRDPVPTIATCWRYLILSSLRLTAAQEKRAPTSAERAAVAEPAFRRAVVRSPQESELVLVLGTYRPAVTVVRALARSGRRAVVGREPDHRHKAESAGAEFSRHTTAVWDHPSIKDDPSAFLDALVGELARRTEPVHVLPLDETTLVLLARERSRLPVNTSLAAPATETILTCLDKERCLDAARTAGLPLPPWQVVRGYQDLLAAAGEAAAPVVVKPLWPHSRLLHDRKAILCRDSSDLARQIPAWPTGHDRLLVQRMMPGPRHNLFFAARDGELLDVVETLTVRTNRHDGTGLAVTGHTRPITIGLSEQLTALVAHLRYTGVGFGQFLVQPGAQDGAFLELNPRISGSHVIADHAGLDLANLAVDLAAGMPVERGIPAPARRDGHTYAWTFGDFGGLCHAIGRGEITRARALAELGRIARTAVLADVHVTWSWRDPVPTLATCWRYLMLSSLHLIPAQASTDTAPGGS